MRSHHYLVLLLACLVAGGTLRAQDHHFTLHNYNPLWLNPAMTGAFSGSVRVGGIYRGQWYTLAGIQTPSAYADAPILRGFRENDWIGVGVNLINDRAGGQDLNLQSTYFGFSAAYHLSLDRQRRNVLTFGAQYGSTSYSLDVGPDAGLAQELTIDAILGGRGGMAGPPELRGGMDEAGASESFSSISAGILLRSVLDPRNGNLFEAGLSALHLNRPKRDGLVMSDSTTISQDEADDLRRRRPTIHAHTRLDIEMSERWRFQPTAFFQYANRTSSLSVQAWGSRELKENIDLRFGLGYRVADAGQILVGLDYNRLRAALSYDLTLSQARAATNYQGGFELSAMYIINIYKKPDVVPTMLCPSI